MVPLKTLSDQVTISYQCSYFLKRRIYNCDGSLKKNSVFGRFKTNKTLKTTISPFLLIREYELIAYNPFNFRENNVKLSHMNYYSL